MDILRDELYRSARLWNNHRIRPSANHESPGGRPDLLFSLPEQCPYLSNTFDKITCNNCGVIVEHSNLEPHYSPTIAI